MPCQPERAVQRTGSTHLEWFFGIVYAGFGFFFLAFHHTIQGGAGLLCGVAWIVTGVAAAIGRKLPRAGYLSLALILAWYLVGLLLHWQV
jgi:hypothetical protein